MTPTPGLPSDPDDADRPAPYAPYGQPQPFYRAPPGRVPEDGAPVEHVPAEPVPDSLASQGGDQRAMHPSASTAMLLGIVSLGGIFLCGLPLLLAPFAWYIGGRTLRQIDADPMRFSGRDRAYAGRAMGMTGTALLVLVIVVIAGSDSEVDKTGDTSYHYKF